MLSRQDGAAMQSQIHWRAPVVMVSSLLIGAALATGHHAFYASLAGSVVSSDPIRVVGWTTTQQQINIAIGTAFAFVIKASLLLACSTAYMQLLFGAIHRTSFKLSTLDNWFSGLSDLCSLGCLASYWRFPMLTIIALTCWLLPIAAIISPASLSVVYDEVRPPPVLLVNVPQPGMDSMAMTTTKFSTMEGLQQLSYGGSPDEASRIALAAATSGTILSIDPPGVNASWELEFSAERYACRPMEAHVVDLVIHNLIEVLDNTTVNATWSDYTTVMFSYLAWQDAENSLSPTPFKQPTSTSGWVLQNTAQHILKETPLDLFVAIIPRTQNVSLVDYPPGFPLDPSAEPGDEATVAKDKLTYMNWFFETATTVRCKTIPTTYRVGFSYGGAQEQHIQILSAVDIAAFHTYKTLLYANVTDEGQLAIFGSDETASQNITSWSKSIFRQNSYATVQLSANALLLGAANSRGLQGQAFIQQDEGPNLTWSTLVFSTILAQTKEMEALDMQSVSSGYNITLQKSGTAFDEAQSLLGEVSDQPMRSFADTLEELYFNITISMASSASLTYNASSPLAPPLTEVTFNIFGNVYSYGSDKLWLAYGIAIGVTLLNVLIGLWSIFQTGASYTNNFSTVIRVAKNSVIAANMREEVLSGKDPLPKHLAKAELRLVEGEGLLESKLHGSVETIHHVVGYAPPRVDSRGWK